MKNKLLILGITALILGMLLVTAMPMNPGNNGKTRVFVSGSPISKFIVKNTFAVQHEFKDGFTVEVDAKGLAALKKIPGIETEAVQLYHITGKPVCGNGIIEGGEKCGEPDLPDCPEGYVCENCKCVEETAPPERACYPSTQTPWGILKVNGGSGGAGVIVAVLDTGVYKDHLDLKANIVDCKDATKRGIKDGCADGNGHGTHVAGTIAANSGSDGLGILGVAPEAKLMAIKVCGNSGFCWGDDIAAGIYYAADNGANIISMSLGGDSPDSRILSAIDYATGEGVLVVAAAGNDRGDGVGSIDYPGAYVKVVAVAAFDSNDAMASFSSLGVNNNDWTIEEKEIEFAAPGVDVESTWKDGCYNVISGTSMSTPHVAGIAARDWKGTASDTRAYLQELAKNYTCDVNDCAESCGECGTTLTGYDYGQTGDDIEAGFGLPIAAS